MVDITIHKFDNIHSLVDANDGIIMELCSEFSFRPPNYQYMLKYKNGIWDGYIRMLNKYTRKIYTGLIPYIMDFAKENDYSFEYINPDKKIFPVEKSNKFFDSLDVHSNNKKIFPFSYQYTGLHHILEKKRVTLLSPTASGKSLLIYAAIRALLDTKVVDHKVLKVLVVVPTTTLTHQLKGDFIDYSSSNKWDSEKNIHLIYAGQPKNSDKSVIISTWQSIYKKDEQYFSQYDAVIIDEAHTVKAASLISILEKCNCKYRIGLTATLDDSEAHKYVVEGLLGKAEILATTKQLMDSGEIAKLQINCIIFHYSDNDKIVKRNYQNELDFILTHKKRNNILVNLCGNSKENTLLLFLRIDHGKYLYKKIKEKYPNRKVFLIYGAVSSKSRNEIRAIVEKEKDAIVIASYGTFAVGINIKKIMQIILSSPSKSKIRLLQSIGRGLRLHKNKKKLKIWDISDDLSWKKRQNYTLMHFITRLKIYINQEFNYQIKKIRI